MTSTLKKGSICVPVYNEAENLTDLYNAFCGLRSRFDAKVELELVITDNNSVDQSWQIIRKICNQDSGVRGFRFGRNIGYQKSILFNFQQAHGNFVVQFDADLQDPPEVIDEMINAWLNGAKLVSGKRNERSEGSVVNLFRKLGYRLLSSASEGILVPDIGDFRLVDNEVLQYILGTKNPSPYLRGSLSKIGFDEIFISYKRLPRHKGKSKFPILRILSLGWNGFLSFSRWPILFFNILMIFTLMISLGFIILILFGLFSIIELSLEWLVLLATITFLALLSATSSAITLFYLRQIYEITTSSDSVYVENHKKEIIKP